MIGEEVRDNSVQGLVNGHLAMARSIASRLKRRYMWVDSDDLYSYSLWGLTQAANAYSPDRGVPFANFAASKAMFLAIDAMREDRVLRRKCVGGRPVTLLHSQLSPERGAPPEDIPDERSGDPAERVEMKDLVANILERLCPEERQLLLLHYADGMTFLEISQVYDKCESTICLRHKALIAKLRRMVKTGQA